ncbi:hypothetical protein FIBSPDRAFT_759444 [Athelia psychrophila]|uniref:2OGFeDO JBP1/TET oxygenase domain-containing protein n=1 Tax=Athelia psychrophila TaxID=1759441 RepID=A0A165YQH5_9AGAM|nr:hypothetical protein FIBSPDRAFT_759444 [Fibularhizoctonia sp. CBS 109695]
MPTIIRETSLLTSPRIPRPITDGSGLVVANVIGHPRDPSWEQVHQHTTELLREAGGCIHCTAKDTWHRCGDFKALAQGIRYGTGMKKPGNTKNTKHNGAILKSLMALKEIMQIVSFTNSCFHTWAPRLHKYYGDMMAALCARHPHLQRNFAKGESVFACSTINFGPATKSFPHTNNNNLAWGWCAVTALGDYDPTRGGHLILWDAKLRDIVIEFPPGSTIFIPSAVFAHSNTSTQPGETHYSFTRYTSGGLFRWVEHGYQGEKAYNAGLSARGKKKEERRKAARWENGMNMYSTIAKLTSLYK